MESNENFLKERFEVQIDSLEKNNLELHMQIKALKIENSNLKGSLDKTSKELHVQSQKGEPCQSNLNELKKSIFEKLKEIKELTMASNQKRGNYKRRNTNTRKTKTTCSSCGRLGNNLSSSNHTRNNQYEWKTR